MRLELIFQIEILKGRSDKVQNNLILFYMKNISLHLFIISLAGIMAFIPCKKVPLVEVTPANRPPVANAGPDQTIILPVNSVTLDGSASTDPDGTITSYKWAKIH